MAGIKLREQSELVDRADVQSKKMSDAFAQMQSHKLETDRLLESYNERFTECQQSIEKSNEVYQYLPVHCGISETPKCVFYHCHTPFLHTGVLQQKLVSCFGQAGCLIIAGLQDASSRRRTQGPVAEAG